MVPRGAVEAPEVLGVVVDRGDLWALTALGRWARMAPDRWARMDQCQWALMVQDPWARWVQGSGRWVQWAMEWVLVARWVMGWGLVARWDREAPWGPSAVLARAGEAALACWGLGGGRWVREGDQEGGGVCRFLYYIIYGSSSAWFGVFSNGERWRVA